MLLRRPGGSLRPTRGLVVLMAEGFLEPVQAEPAEVLPASPWAYSEAGRPVFVSRSYDEHEGEWIRKEQEGAAILWEMAAIAYSLVGLAMRERDAEGVVRGFAGTVRRGASHIYRMAETYGLRLQLEDEGYPQGEALTEGLTFKHFTVAAQEVLNRARDNAREAAEWLEKADDEGWSANELRRRIRSSRPPIPLPEGTYRIIYADPPWEYSDERGNLTGGYGPAERHYPTMSTDGLCEMPVVNLTADDAVLFLWSTSPTLPDALRVIEAWGFTYKSSFVWDKVGHNFGQYNSVRHELLLVATKGSCLPDEQKLFDSVVSVDKTSIHSEKPPVFREMIDTLYTWGPRIELFLRGEAPDGWVGWGNEAKQAELG